MVQVQVPPAFVDHRTADMPKISSPDLSIDGWFTYSSILFWWVIRTDLSSYRKK